MPVPYSITLYKLNEQWLEISGLQDGISAAYINDATVTATLYDSAGAAVTGINALALPYVAASNGIYRGLVPDSFDPAEGRGYRLVIAAVQGANNARWEIPASVEVRRS